MLLHHIGARQLTENSERTAVLGLVADGMGNEEVARRLFLSTRTVERDLSNVYAKLHAYPGSPRAAAAARFSRT